MAKGNELAIWRTIYMPIKQKMYHIKKIGGRLFYAFTGDNGDLPCGRFNNETKMFEPCENKRGRAYAARNRLKNRKRREKFKNA